MGNRAILVTGAHRSGTTWVGQSIANAPGLGYVFEPFTPRRALSMGQLSPAGGFVNPISTWYQYVSEENTSQISDYIRPLLEFRYPVVANVRRSSGPLDWVRASVQWSRFTTHRARRHSAVVKDPHALFSARWMARTFAMDVVITVRHPAAFCSSLKIKNWEFDFDNFLRQPRLLLETRVGDFEAEIRQFAKDPPPIIDQAILLWNCLYAVVNDYRASHPEWLYVRHEDLSRAPESGFREIYAKLGLVFNDRAKREIERSSGSQNPAEQVQGSEFVRNSHLNILNWKQRLTEEEVHTVREGTREVSKFFYSDGEW